MIRKFVSVLLLTLMLGAAAFSETADALKVAGFQGGLIVRLDCAGAAELATLADGPGRLVHGLVKDASNIQVIRQELAAKGLAGVATVARQEAGVLPYVDRSVNLIVADSLAGIPKAEVKSRVILTPEHAKRLLHALTDNIEKYEKMHGPVKNIEPAGGPAMPMNFGGPTGQA